MSRAIRPRRELLLILVGILLAITGMLTGCSGSTSSTSTGTSASDETDTESTVADPLAPVRSADPTQPVGVALGRRFELVLPADPTHGRRWVLDPIDTSIIVALSSTFVDDPELLASTSTSTTIPGSEAGTSSTAPTVTWFPTTTIDPGSPELGPMVQIITFAGRAPATTTVTLRYESIGDTRADPRTVTFTVVVYAEQS